jgi:hypothetical protein
MGIGMGEKLPEWMDPNEQLVNKTLGMEFAHLEECCANAKLVMMLSGLNPLGMMMGDTRTTKMMATMNVEGEGLALICWQIARPTGTTQWKNGPKMT